MRTHRSHSVAFKRQVAQEFLGNLKLDNENYAHLWVNLAMSGMWEGFEARLEENERERSVPLRRTLFNVIRSSGLRPGDGVTKKMLALHIFW